MDQDRAIAVLPQLSRSFWVIQEMEPDVALRFLRRLSRKEAYDVLHLSGSISPDPLDKLLDHLTPDEIADYLRRVKPIRALKLLSSRDQDRADRFFDEMEPTSAGRVLSQMETDAAVAWLARADPDRAALVIESAENRHVVPLLTRLDPSRTELLIGRMRPARAKLLRIVMQRPHNASKDAADD